MRLGFRNLAGLAVLVGTLALLLAGCGGSTTTGPTNKLADAQQIFKPLDSGAQNGDYVTMDPAHVQFGVDYDKAQLFFPPLVTLSQDLKVIAWAAKSWDISTDGKTYTFHLQSGMKWSDGAAIDANTFAYSINRAADPCTASEVENYLSLIVGADDLYAEDCPKGATHVTDTLIGKSVVVKDSLTLAITITAPAAYFLGTMTYPTSYAVPKQLIDKFGDTWTDHLVDNGGFGGNLFKLTVWDHAAHFSFVRNDSFWGTKAAVREVDYTLYKSGDTQWADFKAGKGDFATPTAADLATAKAMPGYFEIASLVVRYLYPSWTKAPFDNLAVRQAFAISFDRSAIASQVYSGAVKPSIHICINGLPCYNSGLKDPAGRTEPDAFKADFTDAQNLVKPYVTSKCGGSYAGCPAFQLTIATPSASQAALGAYLLDQWSQAFPGWKITLNPVARSTEIKQGKDWTLATAGWGADYPDGQDFLSLLINKTALYNYGQVDLAAADALTALADVNTNDAQRQQQYQQAEQLYVTNGAWFSFGQGDQTGVIRADTHGWHLTSSLQTDLPAWQSFYMVSA